MTYLVIKPSSNFNITKQKATIHFLITIVLAAAMIGIMINNTPHIAPTIKYTLFGVSMIPIIENIRVGIKVLRKSGSMMIILAILILIF